jgi:hypothetical protein
MYLSVFTRLSTLNSPTILDYDPFWYYRHAQEILDNNFQVPKWDLLSFFPPGRPNFTSQGWPYTIAIFYKIANVFISISLMKIAIISPVIMAALTVISAYLLGNFLTNKWGGLITALFATLSPALIGVSMAGYCDTDIVVAFYFFLSIFSILLAIKKKSILYYILAIIVNITFVYNWGAGWLPLILFIASLPALIIIRIIDSIIIQRKIKIDIKTTITELKPIIITLLIISIGTNIIALFLNTSTLWSSFFGGLGFTGISGTPLIVNVSVAELQIVNILTKEGFLSVAGRIGLLPTIMTLFGLPLLVFYKIIKKIKITSAEIFLYTFALVTFYLILHGIRFDLQFTLATAATTGYVIGEVVKHLRKNIISATVFGILTLLTLMFVSDAIQIGYSGAGMELSKNWYDMLDWLKQNADKNSLVATWWDPGHIISGYTGLKVHADGAHCGPGSCIPYDHNIRIQNMGRIMSTSDEKEAIDILKKYRQLTPEQCQQVKQKFDGIVPEEACKPINEMYFISSSDLIGKFTWMNYFGGYRAPIKSNEDFQANPGVCCASTPKTEPGQVSCGEFANQGKGVWIWCPWIFSFKEVKQDQEGNSVYVYDYSGLTIAILQKNNQLIPIYNNRFIINHITFFQQGIPNTINLANITTSLERIDGLIWIDPGFKSLIYFAPSIKDSIFTKTFFYDGENLEHFELVYSNPEIKLYKINF